MNEVAKDFLARCFAPGSTIALLLRTESPAKTQQRVVTLEQALAPCAREIATTAQRMVPRHNLT